MMKGTVWNKWLGVTFGLSLHRLRQRSGASLAINRSDSACDLCDEDDHNIIWASLSEFKRHASKQEKNYKIKTDTMLQ